MKSLSTIVGNLYGCYQSGRRSLVLAVALMGAGGSAYGVGSAPPINTLPNFQPSYSHIPIMGQGVGVRNNIRAADILETSKSKKQQIERAYIGYTRAVRQGDYSVAQGHLQYILRLIGRVKPLSWPPVNRFGNFNPEDIANILATPQLEQTPFLNVLRRYPLEQDKALQYYQINDIIFQVNTLEQRVNIYRHQSSRKGFKDTFLMQTDYNGKVLSFADAEGRIVPGDAPLNKAKERQQEQRKFLKREFDRPKKDNAQVYKKIQGWSLERLLREQKRVT